MPKIKIEEIINRDQISRNGKSYTRCLIKTVNNHGETIWISGFGNDTTKSWQKGQVVELDIYPENYQGKIYYKFKEPAQRNIYAEIDQIKEKLDALLQEKKIKPKITVEEIEEISGEEPRDPPMSDIPDFLR